MKTARARVGEKELNRGCVSNYPIVLCSNIRSYAGGCDMWGYARRAPRRARDAVYSPAPSYAPAMSDGALEVLGIASICHVGMIFFLSRSIFGGVHKVAVVPQLSIAFDPAIDVLHVQVPLARARARAPCTSGVSRGACAGGRRGDDARVRRS